MTDSAGNPIHLYRVEEGGEHFAWPGTSEADAIGRHIAATKRDTDKVVDPGDCTATQYGRECLIMSDESTAPVVGDMPEWVRKAVGQYRNYSDAGQSSLLVRWLADRLDAREREIAEKDRALAIAEDWRQKGHAQNKRLQEIADATRAEAFALRTRLERAERERENLAHEVAREVFDACAAEEFGAGNSPDWSVPLRAIVARAILLYASRPASLDGEGKDG